MQNHGATWCRLPYRNVNGGDENIVGNRVGCISVEFKRLRFTDKDLGVQIMSSLKEKIQFGKFPKAYHLVDYPLVQTKGQQRL